MSDPFPIETEWLGPAETIPLEIVYEPGGRIFEVGFPPRGIHPDGRGWRTERNGELGRFLIPAREGRRQVAFARRTAV
jgi:hypothetical protein